MFLACSINCVSSHTEFNEKSQAVKNSLRGMTSISIETTQRIEII